jgi:hypothetical protein
MLKLESNRSNCTGRSTENFMQQQSRLSGKMKEGMKLSLLPKLVEKLVWVPLFRFVKFHSIGCPYYAETGHSRPLIA